MNSYEKSLLLDMTKDYDDVLHHLEDIKYMLRIQGRHREADMISEAVDQIRNAKAFYLGE